MKNEELLSKYYRYEDMLDEIEKAHEIGCGCFYMDPGWDTEFGSNIWDEKRLGKQVDFVKMLKEKYGMTLALHTPLAPWSDTTAYNKQSKQMDAAGRQLDILCVISKQYKEEKLERLKKLCEDGAYFLMYDGSWYDYPCHDPNHGHAVPSTRQEHVDAILDLSQELHKAYPEVLIEQHDPITGPGTPRYVPTYYMNAKPGAFDELWGFEYMVTCLDDILSHRAFSLYYLNLAYSIPAYLHVDLRTDVEGGLVFWWYASTCRHLGFGGKHKNEKIWDFHKKSMRLYMENKTYFTQGIFYGIDEMTHIHSIPELGSGIVNCFNLDDKPVRKMLAINTADIGLAHETAGETIRMEIDIPAMGHRLLKIDRRNMDILR